MSDVGPTAPSSAEQVALAFEVPAATPDPLALVDPLATVTPTPGSPTSVVVSDEAEQGAAEEDDAAQGDAEEDDAEQDDSAQGTAEQEPELLPTEDQPTTTPIPTSTPPPLPVASPFTVGACYTEQGWHSETSTSCSNSHALQVILAGTFSEPAGTSYPGVEGLRVRVDQECDRMLLPLGLVSGSDVVTASSAPGKPGWDAGLRTWACLLVSTSTLDSIVADRDRAVQQAAANEAAAAEAAEALARARAPLNLNVGDCVGPDRETKVSCSSPYAFKVFAVANVASANGVYPGVDFVNQQGEEFCRREAEELGLTGDLVGLYPSRSRWEQLGERSHICLEANT